MSAALDTSGSQDVARVGVTATVLWSSPTAPRQEDAAAIARVPDLIAWAAGKADDQRRRLVGRAETHALLGDEVLVVKRVSEWAEVRLPDQRSSKAAEGYPGWIPSSHLLPATPRAGTERAIVIGDCTVIGRHRGGPIRLSFGTILPVLERRHDHLLLAHPDGSPVIIDATSVRIIGEGSPQPGPELGLAAVQVFAGTAYLWGGASGAGVDCSGLVYLAYRSIGIPVPRDANDQERAAAPVGVSSATPGEPLFFANDRGVHHVALALGAGLGGMLHAPRTGQPVQEGSVGDAIYRGETVTAGRLC